MNGSNAKSELKNFWRATTLQASQYAVMFARYVRVIRRQLSILQLAIARRLTIGRSRLYDLWQQTLKNGRRAMRRISYVRGNLAYWISRREDKPGRMRLRVLHGLHSGAQRTCKDGEAILIGSDKDCDIALQDSGVAAHHCILTVADGTVSARDIDARVRVERRKHRLSRTCRSNTWWRVALTDDVVVGLGPAGRSEWDLAADAPGRMRGNAHRALAAVAGFTGIAIVAAAMALSADAFRPKSTPSPTTHPKDLESLLSELKLDEIEIDAMPDSVIRLHGVVPATAELDQLRQKLEQKRVDVELDVRIGEDIARDVREVLRLSGITAKSRYKGAGEVEIIGKFADDELLESVVSSRAMLEITQLESVVAVYAGGKKVPEGKNIVAVVRGADPYVVTADGSRYYVGAILPNGETLQEINDEEVLITNGTQTERLEIKTLQASSSNS